MSGTALTSRIAYFQQAKWPSTTQMASRAMVGLERPMLRACGSLCGCLPGDFPQTGEILIPTQLSPGTRHAVYTALDRSNGCTFPYLVREKITRSYDGIQVADSGTRTSAASLTSWTDNGIALRFRLRMSRDSHRPLQAKRIRTSYRRVREHIPFCRLRFCLGYGISGQRVRGRSLWERGRRFPNRRERTARRSGPTSAPSGRRGRD